MKFIASLITLLGLICLLVIAPTYSKSSSSGNTTHSSTKKINRSVHHAKVSHGQASKDDISSVPTTNKEGEDLDPQTIAKLSGKQANSYYSLAQKKEKAGQLTQAQKYYCKALAIRERIWGDRDPAAAQIIDKIGDIYLKRGNAGAANTCFKRHLAIVAKRFGPGAPEMVPTLNKLGQVAMSQKQFGEAYDYYSRVLSLEERKMGDDANETVAARLNVIDAAVGVHDWQEAQKNLKKAEGVAQKSGDNKSNNYLRICDNYAKVLSALNKPSEAEAYARQAQALQAANKDSNTEALTKEAKVVKAKPTSSSKKKKVVGRGHSAKTATTHIKK